jgi:hypothetical protein
MDSVYYGPHFTKQDYNCALNNAPIWALENPEEPSIATVAARIYHVNEDSLRVLVLRSKKKEAEEFRRSIQFLLRK